MDGDVGVLTLLDGFALPMAIHGTPVTAPWQGEDGNIGRVVRLRLEPLEAQAVDSAASA